MSKCCNSPSRRHVIFTTASGFLLLVVCNLWVVQQDFAFSNGNSFWKASPPGRLQSKEPQHSSRRQTNHTILYPGDFNESTLVLPPPPYMGGSRERFNHSIIYVHVGKTGGITLDTVLRSNCMWYEGSWKRRKCLKSLEDGDAALASGPSMLSELTQATLHFGPRRDYDQWIQNATLFMVTLRNPIDRAVSAFNFDHPSNNDARRYEKGVGVADSDSVQHFYQECFPTVQHMVDLLQLVDDHHKDRIKRSALTKRQLRCYDTARRTLAGNGSKLAASHLRMNYAFYNQLTVAHYPGRPLLVVRTEYMWEDLARIDRMLGGKGYFAHAGTAYTHGSRSHLIRQGISTVRGKQIVCCYLAKEMQIYENWLRSARNLFPVEIGDSLSEVYSDCGLENMAVWNRTLWQDSAISEGDVDIQGVDGSFFAWENWASTRCPLASALF